MKADEKQVGGEHYKVFENRLQHWNVVAEMGWDYFIGNATKYLWRLGEKGGPEKAIEDIGKSIHYLEKKRELMVEELKYSIKPVQVDTSEPVPGYVNQDR